MASFLSAIGSVFDGPEGKAVAEGIGRKAYGAVSEQALATYRNMSGNLGHQIALGVSVAAGVLSGFQGDRNGRTGRVMAGAAHGAVYGLSLIRAAEGIGGGSFSRYLKAATTGGMRNWTAGIAAGSAWSLATGGNMTSGAIWGAAAGGAIYGHSRFYNGFEEGFKNYSQGIINRRAARNLPAIEESRLRRGYHQLWSAERGRQASKWLRGMA